MNSLNFVVFLIFGYGSLGDKTSNKSKYGSDEVYVGGFRNYYFTPDPTNYYYPEPDSSEAYEEAKSEHLEKMINNQFDTYADPDINSMLHLNDDTVKDLLLNQYIENEDFNLEFDYETPESKPVQVSTRRQVNWWENSNEDSNTFGNPDFSYPKTKNVHDHGQYFKGNLPFNLRNNFSSEKVENNYQIEPPQFHQNNHYQNNPLLRKRQDQNEHLVQKSGPINENLKPGAMDEKSKRKKNQKKNPCKLYLQFLKYAFKELDKNSEYYDELDEESSEWEAEGSRQVFSTQLLGPTLYIDNSGRVFQVNSRGNSIQSVDGFLPVSRDSEKNFIGQNFMTTNSPYEYKTEMAPAPPIYNSFILTYDQPSNFMNMNTERPVSETYPPTVPTEVNTETERPIFLTTTPPTPLTSSPPSPPYQVAGEENYRKSEIPWEHSPKSRANYSSVGSPLYLQRLENSTTISPPRSENHIFTNTKVSLENKPKQENKVPDCNDKMLPCPDTFNITYPLNGYCNRYVTCESGVAIRRTCANGFHFNVVTKSCDLPHNSICSYFCPEPNGHFGIPGDCSGYFICENSVFEYRMCPPKMHWDVKTHSCTFASLSNCPMKCSNHSEIKAYKGDCKAYIICHDGIPFYHKCPSKFVFNKESHTCVPENTYSCKNDPRLMTKTLNPSHLCKNVDDKLSENSWCKYYNLTENAKAEEKFKTT